MKNLVVIFILVLLNLGSKAQVRNSLSAGGGITYPAFAEFADYGISWNTSVHWNIGLGRFSYIDTHIDLAGIRVKDYPGVPGSAYDDHIYQVGVGYRQYFLKHFFVRGGVAAAIVNDGEASGRIFPNLGVGYDVFITKRHGIEFNLKNDFINNFDYQRHISIFSLGVAYKFWYPAR